MKQENPLDFNFALARIQGINKKVVGEIDAKKAWLAKPHTKDKLNEFADNMQTTLAQLEKLRKAIVGPFWSAHRELSEEMRDTINGVKKLYDNSKTKIYEIEKKEREAAAAARQASNQENAEGRKKALDDLQEKRERRRGNNDPERTAELEAAERAAEERVVESSAPPPPPPAPKATITEYNITDFDVNDFSAVPDKFKMIDPNAVKAALSKGEEIPGITKITRKAIRRRRTK